MDDEVNTGRSPVQGTNPTETDLELDGPIELDDWDPQDAEEQASDANEGSDDSCSAAVRAKMDTLRSLYVETQRDADLSKQFERLLAEKDSPVPIRRWAGLVVKAPSGAGKTRMLNRFLENHPRINAFGTDKTNFVNIDVPSPVTNKTLGLEVLRTMYPQRRGIVPSGRGGEQDATLSDTWREARMMAAELDIWGLWLDEAHDLRNGGPKMLDVLQASFKRWMAHEHRPLLILSGTPNVEDIFLTREFRRRFLVVESQPLSAQTDTVELRRIIAKYLREASLGVDESLRGFMPRLIHAGTRQIGWTLDVVLESIRAALLESADRLAIEHFATSYADIVQCSDRDNPFIADDWASIDTVLHRARQEEVPSPLRRRRRKREEMLW